MRGWATWLLVTLGLAVVVHVAAVRLLPYGIMWVVMRRGAEVAGWNAPLHPPLATSAARAIVRPSPDLAYTSCMFDVRAAPLLVSAPVGNGYASVSMFADNTDNFFALNDRQAEGASIDVVVAGPHTPPFDAGGRRVVRSPSDRGIVLVRRVVENPEHFVAVDQLRRRARCEPLPPPAGPMRAAPTG
ncbi:MAG: DUF1254 domain-containing protein [Deltaproteobacteria bacterium]|nr:DUF1254 domain-containing protein [Deltaproteobacteria bacterium]